MNKQTVVNVIATILTFSIAIYDYTHHSSDTASIFLIFGVIYLGLTLASWKK